MKTLEKFVSQIAISWVMGAALVGCSSIAPAGTQSLPRISSMTADVGRAIARDLSVELSARQFWTQPARTTQTASVVITEISEAMVVEASRLPASEPFAAGASVARNVTL